MISVKRRYIIVMMLLSCVMNGVHARSIQDLIDRGEVPRPRYVRVLYAPVPISVLDLSGKKLDSLQGFEQLNLEGVSYIKLDNNNLTVVPTSAFDNRNAHYIHGLNLSDNNITTLKPGAFKGLGKLWILLLSNNSLEDISAQALQGIPRLKFLSIYKNPLSASLEDALALQQHVPHAYIWNEKITKEYLKKAGIGTAALGVAALVIAGAGYAMKRHKKYQNDLYKVTSEALNFSPALGDRLSQQKMAQRINMVPSKHKQYVVHALLHRSLIQNWRDDLVLYLVNQIQDIDSSFHDGNTPLELAKKVERPVIIEAIRKKMGIVEESPEEYQYLPQKKK